VFRHGAVQQAAFGVAGDVGFGGAGLAWDSASSVKTGAVTISVFAYKIFHLWLFPTLGMRPGVGCIIGFGQMLKIKPGVDLRGGDVGVA
jgi:hypothetical protein